MGCRGSKQKEPKEPQHNGDAALPDGAAGFMALVNTTQHPVARKTLEEWSVFVDAHTRRRQHDTSRYDAILHRPSEMWATTDREPVTHESVDEVGKSFLAYLKNDLVLRGWSGEFDYAVSGVEQQGYLKLSARIEMGPIDGNRIDEQKWEMRIHYHC